MTEHDTLASTARALVAPQKGILAADESTGTIEKRFKSVGLVSTEELRRDYREMMFTTRGLGDFISGVILYDETIRQKGIDGRLLVDDLKHQGIIPGIKVDLSTKPLAGFPGETITEGLDGLRDRLADYAKLGARFTKWRAVIKISETLPTDFAIKANAHALARYAALSQEAGLVPIVEPEVLMDGDHSIEEHFDVTQRTLNGVFSSLFEHRVKLDGMLLKTGMVVSGKKSAAQSSVAAVASATLSCLRATVPVAVPGIVFLSGGQGDIEATAHLDAMNREANLPWALSFSYGRALQAPSLEAWKGRVDHREAGQQALHHRARMNSAARQGNYTEAMEDKSA